MVNTRSTTTDKKKELRNDLIKLYGNNKNLLNTAEINQYVSKLNNPGMNSFNIKKMAYKKAYEKYYNYMLGNFAYSIFNVTKKKFKNSPTCPSGVEPEAVKNAARSELFKLGLKKAKEYATLKPIRHKMRMTTSTREYNK
jgi:predicted S18 family serine protease